MNPAVESLLNSFEDLSAADQYEVTREILRRTSELRDEEIPDESLIATADTLFRELDAREAADAGPTAG